MEIELHYPLTHTHTHTLSLSQTVSRACAQLACFAWHLPAEAKHWLHSPPWLCFYLSMSQRVNVNTHTSSQVTFIIYIALFTIEIVSKQLYRD